MGIKLRKVSPHHDGRVWKNVLSKSELEEIDAILEELVEAIQAANMERHTRAKLIDIIYDIDCVLDASKY